MPLWTLIGLAKGKATTAWPRGGSDGQEGVLGMPRYDRSIARRLRGVRRRVPDRGDQGDDRGGDGSTSITAAASSASFAPKHVRPAR